MVFLVFWEVDFMFKCLVFSSFVAIAIGSTVFNSGAHGTGLLSSDSTTGIYGATCYQPGKLSTNYCSDDCGWTETRVASVVEAPESGQTRTLKNCKNSETCTVQQPELTEDACSWGEPDPTIELF